VYYLCNFFKKSIEYPVFWKEDFKKRIRCHLYIFIV
jgi:hypothetical protein